MAPKDAIVPNKDAPEKFWSAPVPPHLQSNATKEYTYGGTQPTS